MNEEREEQHTPADDAQDAETRRDFLKKLSYVAPLMITFQMDEEASAQKGKDTKKGGGKAQKGLADAQDQEEKGNKEKDNKEKIRHDLLEANVKKWADFRGPFFLCY